MGKISREQVFNKLKKEYDEYTKFLNSYESYGYTELYANYLKNDKKSTMSEQDAYKYYKKMNGDYNIDKLKEAIEEIKNKREDDYNQFIENMCGTATEEQKIKMKNKLVQKYPFENLFMHQY